jgi:hypothetical protein
VRAGALSVMSVVFACVPQPWTRAAAVASFAALVLMSIGVLDYEMFRSAR